MYSVGENNKITGPSSYKTAKFDDGTRFVVKRFGWIFGSWHGIMYGNFDCYVRHCM